MEAFHEADICQTVNNFLLCELSKKYSKESKDYKGWLFCVVTVNDWHTKPRFKRSLGLNLKTTYAANCV